jgi:hypothetical protein
MILQEDYLRSIADKNYNQFYKQGYATPGNNGPHGHPDTPVRNTSHYIIIYGYLYKKTFDKKYIDICNKFAEYICEQQENSKSGAIQCMINNKFDYLNGLIGQAWVIEALIYLYDIVKNEKYLDTAYNIYFSQKYNYDLHLWERIELDGSNIGIDNTYNHNVWFAACSYRLAELKQCLDIDKHIKDFLTHGVLRDFRVTRKGLLKHTIGLKNHSRIERVKKIIKIFSTPIRFINRRKLDISYIEYAYQIFDIYGFEILKEKYGYLDFFKSKKFIKAERLACNLKWYDKKNILKRQFNVFSYSYNSPAFELPYVLKSADRYNSQLVKLAFETQKKLMYSEETQMFTLNNYDVELLNARCYEIVRYLEME